MISLSIDGKKANVNEGATVLEAARSVGEPVPPPIPEEARTIVRESKK